LKFNPIDLLELKTKLRNKPENEIFLNNMKKKVNSKKKFRIRKRSNNQWWCRKPPDGF
jgi:hypothetical protein